MRNTYIIALKEGNEPHYIKIKPLNSLAFLGLHYKQAYLMENKTQADKTWRQWYDIRQERKNDENYPDFF
jgi:hypothetical protein